MAEIFGLGQKILEYISTNLPTYLDSIGVTDKPNEYVLGFPEPSKYAGKMYLYLDDITDYQFEREGNFTLATATYNIYITFKNYEDNVGLAKRYLEYFYDFVLQSRHFGGLADSAWLQKCHPWEGIEGATTVAADSIELVVNKLEL